MSYLLDTHTFLWTVFEPHKLSPRAREVIQNPENSVVLSVLSLWEISLKFSLGKLILKNCSPEDLFKIAIQKMNIDFLDLTPAQASSFYKLPRMPHRDPFDRMIVWQAIQQQLILISSDKELQNYVPLGLRTLW